MVSGYEYKLPEQIPRLGADENDGGEFGLDAVNSNSIVLYERYSGEISPSIRRYSTANVSNDKILN